MKSQNAAFRLRPLVLTTTTFANNQPAGTLLAQVLGCSGGSRRTVLGPAAVANRVALANIDGRIWLVAGSAGTGIGLTINDFWMQEEHPGSNQKSKISTFSPSVVVAPTLQALSVTPTSITVGTAYSGTVVGRTAGSTLALTGAGAAGLSVNSSTGAITGTPTTEGAINIVETLAGATNTPRTTNAVLTVGPAVGVGAFAVDTTALTDSNTSWHTDPVILTLVGGTVRAIYGYSKANGSDGGKSGIVEFSPIDGASLDARIVQAGIFTENDHLSVSLRSIRNGAFAGGFWGTTVPHNQAIFTADAARFDFIYSPTGRTINADLAATVFAPDGQHNYAHMGERSDGRLIATTIRDAAPQSARVFWTDDPDAAPTYGRPIYDMSTGVGPGGSPQIYTNSVPGRIADTEVDYTFIHVSVPEQGIGRAVKNLTTGLLTVNGVVQNSAGSFYATGGGVIAPFGSLPKIYTPPTDKSARVHDVCAFGKYYGGYAVAITEFTTGANATDATHFILTCEPGLDPDNSANWVKTQVGASNRASPPFWTSSNYTRDIRFLWCNQGISVGLIAHLGSGVFRAEVWTGTGPGTLSLEWNGLQDDAPFLTRLHPVPGRLPVRFVANLHSVYNDFNNMTSAGSQLPVIGQIAATFNALSLSSTSFNAGTARVLSIFDTAQGFCGTGGPSVLTVTSGALPTGATLDTINRRILVPDTAPAGTYNFTLTETDPSGSITARATALTITVASIALRDWLLTDLPAAFSFQLWDPLVGVIGTTEVSEWAGRNNADAAVPYTQATAGLRPALVDATPDYVDFAPTTSTTGGRYLQGGSGALSFMTSAGTMAYFGVVRPDVVTGGARTLAADVASNTNLRARLRITTAGNYEYSVRRSDTAGSASTVSIAGAAAGTDQIVSAIALFRETANGGSKVSIHLGGGAEAVAGTPPTDGATNSSVAAASSTIGATTTLTDFFDGRMYALLRLKGNSGEALTAADRERIEGLLSWRFFGNGDALAVGHPYKSARPQIPA